MEASLLSLRIPSFHALGNVGQRRNNACHDSVWRQLQSTAADRNEVRLKATAIPLFRHPGVSVQRYQGTFVPSSPLCTAALAASCFIDDVDSFLWLGLTAENRMANERAAFRSKSK
jgi:hypothetical protein